MIVVFSLFAVLLVFLSYRSLINGIAYLRYFRKELARPLSGFTPFVSIIVPCRGVDEGLEQNLRALVDQDYPDYEVIFVVSDESDPAVLVIKALLDEAGISTMLAVAPKAKLSGQKVENLREAVLHCSGGTEILVFTDSDARPPADWLRHLVAPLENEDVGAATGYRWFISKIPTFASELRSAWNASIATALGPNAKSNFCWGGSTAIRREVFERLDIRGKWSGTLSDDFTVTRTLKGAGLPIVFVPRALVATIENCTLHEMLEFTTRQMKITRVYAPALWLTSLFGSGLFSFVLIAAFLLMVLSPQKDVSVAVAGLMIMLVAAFSIGKSWLRLEAVKLALPEYRRYLRRQFWPQNTLWLITPVLFFYNCLAALASRRLTWRGITYQLKSPHETVIIAD